MSAASVKSLDNQAIVATGLTKWFGEGETKVTAVNGVALVAHLKLPLVACFDTAFHQTMPSVAKHS
jgi:hypothetical protein